MLQKLKTLKDFIVTVAHDARIPERDKKVVLVLLGLLLSPIDIIPDWIPIFGAIDDLIIVALLLDYFFEVLDQEILLSHYPWSYKSYIRTRKYAKFVSWWAPRRIKNLIWKYRPSPYRK